MIVFHGRTSLQAGGARAGRIVRWEDADVQAVQSQAPDCQYAIPELEQEDVRTHSNLQQCRFSGDRVATSDLRTFAASVGSGRFYNWDDERDARRVAFLGTRRRQTTISADAIRSARMSI